MGFDPRAEGFYWPETRTVSNPSGETRTITPRLLDTSIEGAKNDLERMAYRFYEIIETGAEVSEDELLLWRAGGMENVLATRGLICSVFKRKGGSDPQSVSIVELERASRRGEGNVSAVLEYLEARGTIRINEGRVEIVDRSFLSEERCL